MASHTGEFLICGILSLENTPVLLQHKGSVFQSIPPPNTLLKRQISLQRGRNKRPRVILTSFKASGKTYCRLLAVSKTSGCLHMGDLPGYNALRNTKRITHAEGLQCKKRSLFLLSVFVAPTQELFFIMAILTLCRVPKSSLIGEVKVSYSYSEIRTFPEEPL